MAKLTVKANVFIEGRYGERKQIRIKRRRRRKDGSVRVSTRTQDKNIPKQVARDFVGHDEAVVEMAAELAVDQVLETWGWK